MAKSLDEYADDLGPVETDFPDGKYLDESGGDPGTSIKADGKNQIYYFFSKLMDSVSLAFDGVLDNFTDSQFFTALTTRINDLIDLSATSKGFNAVVLTNYENNTVPAIGINSACDINGAIYKNTSEVAISGATVNSTWYEIKLIPSGTTFTASFVPLETGLWSDTKQGMYSTNDRIIGMVYRNGSGGFEHKNVYQVLNRTIKVKFKIGIWDMDATAAITIPHGYGTGFLAKVVRMTAQIISDTNIPRDLQSGNVSTFLADGILDMDDQQFIPRRTAGGTYDSTLYDDGSQNRGFIVMDYEV